MSNILVILNYGFVLIYGIILTFSFVGALKANKDTQTLLATILTFGVIQLFVYFTLGQNFLFKAYPFLIHIPLLLFLIYGMKKPPLPALISVLSAYLLCTPRQWVGTFVAAFFQNSQAVAYVTEILVTAPLLFLICKHFTPHIVTIRNESKKLLRIFIIIPFFYYVMEYVLTVYSNLLYSGSAVTIEFIDCFIIILYFFFSILYISELNRRKEVEMDSKINVIKSGQAENEIEQLKKSQEQAAIYRHDLIHHLNYIRVCIKSQQTGDALSYISEMCTNIENQKVETYCENITVNMILSAYIAKAKNSHITVNTDIKMSAGTNIPATDLCIILANGLDNAIHASQMLDNVDERFISIAARQQKGKLFFKIENSFDGTVEFEDDLPKAKLAGHGTGTKSIALTVKKHNGMFSFDSKDGLFTVMVSI